MIARQALFTHIRAFFEQHLRGIYSYDDCVVRPAEEAPKVPGKRRFEYGRTREIVHVGFGDYDLVVLSPVEAPPLGRVELGRREPEGVVNLVTGPIDTTTFESAARIIKSATKEEQIR